MNDRQIKIWLSVFVFTLMAVGGGASYFAQGRTFFKGLEPLREQESGNREQLYASVLNAEAESLEQTPEEEDMQEAAVEEKPEPKTQPVSSPCGSGEKPKIKNGEITGCSTEPKNPEPVKQLKPGPKVKIIENIEPPPFPSCASQDKFTYTGPDRPGLLYGMCIECEMNSFIIHGGRCQ